MIKLVKEKLSWKGGKISGAGAGGCFYFLIPPYLDIKLAKAKLQQLCPSRMTIFEASLGACEGRHGAQAVLRYSCARTI